MKRILTLAIYAGILSPFVASAQLVDIVGPPSSGDALFDGLVTAMATADPHPLWVPEGSATKFDQMYFDGTSWTTGSNDFSAGNTNFKLLDDNVDYFFLEGSVNVGFVTNENWDWNELYVNAYAPGDIGGTPDPKQLLFDYSDEPGEGTSTPGMTASITLKDGVNLAVLGFEHVNTDTISPFDPTPQSSQVRFRMYQQVTMNDANEMEYLNAYMWGTNDRDDTFDRDRDDGWFLVVGDVRAVPEPSAIAALALLGLGGIVFARRRFKMKK